MGTEDVKVTVMNMYKYKKGLRFYKRWAPPHNSNAPASEHIPWLTAARSHSPLAVPPLRRGTSGLQPHNISMKCPAKAAVVTQLTRGSSPTGGCGDFAL